MSTKMSVTRALATLTKVEEKIQKRIEALNTIHIAKGTDANRQIPGSLQSVEDFEKSAQADFQGVQDLLAVRDDLKAKVVQSNAVTKVEIAGESMTVAQAIERKRTIVFKELLLGKLKSQYNHAQVRLNRDTQEFEAKLEAARAPYVQRDKAPDAAQLAVVEAPVRSMGTPSIVDPLGLADRIRSLEAEIEDFKSNVDFVLSESNARTEVEIEGSI